MIPGKQLFQALFDGPLDVIGDVHGELGALRDLLAALGYHADGRHPAGRRLVFIGDLCDRGPDSPGVIALVAELVERGLAQCLLGNHELNVLRKAHKEGNGWFFADDHDARHGKFTDAARAGDADRASIRSFFAGLPAVLERGDLRLVHAAWDDAALSLLRDCQAETVMIHDAYDSRVQGLALKSGLIERAHAEQQQYQGQLTDLKRKPPLLENVGRLDALEQMANPLRIATSGHETLASEPFFAAGKWRMVDRVRWWDHYRHEVPVLMGHYWRWPTPKLRADFTRGEHDLFNGAGLDAWLGARRNVYCMDFGVGARYQERRRGVKRDFATRLGAVRWPEREVVTDDGAGFTI